MYHTANWTLCLGMNPTTVIDDLPSLDLWVRQVHSMVSSRHLPAVQFRVQGISGEQNQEFSALSSRFQTACGCSSGAVFMSFSVVAMLANFFTSGNTLSDIGLTDALSFVGIAVLAALTGKALGLFWARCRLMRLATSVRELVLSAPQRAAA